MGRRDEPSDEAYRVVNTLLGDAGKPGQAHRWRRSEARQQTCNESSIQAIGFSTQPVSRADVWGEPTNVRGSRPCGRGAC
jgi:hypothetical protein